MVMDIWGEKEKEEDKDIVFSAEIDSRMDFIVKSPMLLEWLKFYFERGNISLSFNFWFQSRKCWFWHVRLCSLILSIIQIVLRASYHSWLHYSLKVSSQLIVWEVFIPPIIVSNSSQSHREHFVSLVKRTDGLVPPVQRV